MRGQPPASQAGTWHGSSRRAASHQQPAAVAVAGSGRALAPQQLASTTTCQCSHAERALRRCCPRVGPVPLRDAAFARRRRAVAAAAAAQ
eukprot:COSAG01_NODE_2846_length_6985_cov_212.725860_11_plen_90_part_00